MSASTVSADSFPDRELASLGRRVAAARHGSGLTLTGLAERTGVSAAFISQIESGTANPTARTLVQLASAFGLGLADLFGPGDSAPASRSFDPRVAAVPRAAEAPGRPALFDLTASGSSALGVRLLHSYAADHADPVSHGGEEFLMVLAGTCVLRIGDTLSRQMAALDHCHLSAEQMHQVAEPSDDLLMLVVFTPLAEGAAQ